jgi:hypothetical protein
MFAAAGLLRAFNDDLSNLSDWNHAFKMQSKKKESVYSYTQTYSFFCAIMTMFVKICLTAQTVFFNKLLPQCITPTRNFDTKSNATYVLFNKVAGVLEYS